MRTDYKDKKITWVDLENPTREELVDVMDEFKIHHIVAEELGSPTVRPKVDLYDNAIYVILHFPVVTRHPHQRKIEQEIDFVIGKNFLITAHYDTIDPLYEFGKAFETNALLQKSKGKIHAGFVFFYIVRVLYKNLETKLQALNRNLKETEENIFNGQEAKMVRVLSEINRQLLGLSHGMRFHQEIWRSFESAGKQFFDKEFEYYLSSLTEEYYKTYNILEGHREVLRDLQKTNQSLLTTKTNNVMKTITLLAFTTLPITITTGIMSMNPFVPFLNTKYAFWIILGITIAVGIGVFVYFKRRNWV